MDRVLEEQQPNRYRNVQPLELERRPCGQLEKEESARLGGHCLRPPPGAPPPLDANAALSSPRKATLYLTTSASTAQDANTVQSK